MKKNIGFNGINALQSIDYTYNLRGWLTHINSVNVYGNNTGILTPTSIGEGAIQNLLVSPLIRQAMLDMTAPYKSNSPFGGRGAEMPPINDNNPDLFSEKMDYATPDSRSGAPPQYNGNISALTWQVLGRDKQAYGFKYDDLDRLLEAQYFDLTDTYNKTGEWNSNYSTDNKFMEKQTYDLRGNILTLQRNGLNDGSFTSNGYTAATYGLIDNMTYTYNAQNQLLIVKDNSLLDKGFKSINNPNETQYTYDTNGNMKTDLNKGITNIEYNYLNLPQVITFTGNRAITFVYDASGAKLQKITNNNGVITTYDYVNGVEYKNNVLQRIAHTEGSVSRQDDGTYLHEYVLRDHLGNTRVTFTDANNDGVVGVSDIKQINHYYPFGLNMEGNWNGAAGSNKYGYNGKEWNDEFGLGWNDYGKRFYDPKIVRFWTKDRLVKNKK